MNYKNPKKKPLRFIIVEVNSEDGRTMKVMRKVVKGLVSVGNKKVYLGKFAGLGGKKNYEINVSNEEYVAMRDWEIKFAGKGRK